MKHNPNNTYRSITLVFALIALAAPTAWGQLPDSQNVDASATLTIPLEISNTQNMNFGELIKTAAHNSGEVVASFGAGFGPATPITFSGPGVVDPDPGDHEEAGVWFTGDPSKQVVIDVGPTTITLEKPGATTDQQRMVLDQAPQLSDLNGWISPSAPGIYQLTEGPFVFEIGGSLHIKFDNESGVYSGTIPVTLSYL